MWRPSTHYKHCFDAPFSGQPTNRFFMFWTVPRSATFIGTRSLLIPQGYHKWDCLDDTKFAVPTPIFVWRRRFRPFVLRFKSHPHAPPPTSTLRKPLKFVKTLFSYILCVVCIGFKSFLLWIHILRIFEPSSCFGASVFFSLCIECQQCALESTTIASTCLPLKYPHGPVSFFTSL